MHSSGLNHGVLSPIDTHTHTDHSMAELIRDQIKATKAGFSFCMTILCASKSLESL